MIEDHFFFFHSARARAALSSRIVWKKLRLVRTITKLIGDGILASEIESSCPLDEIRQAVAEAEQPGGKILLRISESG